MDNLKIALALTIKGEGEEKQHLERALKSISPHVDKIFITLSGERNKIKDTIEICKQFKAEVFFYRPFIKVTPTILDWVKINLGYSPLSNAGEQIFDFAKAKNFTLSKISHDYPWILWMDCDDIFKEGEKLRDLVNIVTQQDAGIVYLNYLYHVITDKDFNVLRVITKHPRERLIRNGYYKWEGIIHEVLKSQKGEIKGLFNDECTVVHITSQEDRQNSLLRNIKSLEVSIAKDQFKNPHLIYYLAKAFYDLRQPQFEGVSQSLMMKYLIGDNSSQWPEERAQAWGYIADIYLRHNDPDSAIKALMNGLMDDPQHTDLYLDLTEAYVVKKNWERALFWLKIRESVPTKMGFLATTPSITEVRILEMAYKCYFNLSMFAELKDVSRRLLEINPNHPLPVPK